jgi:hypothetical protein
MIDSKDAVKQAMAYFRELFPTAQDPRLEEVERSPDAQYWLVTISFAKPDVILFGAAVTNPNREYKIVKLNAKTGSPEGIKMRLFGLGSAS